MSTESLLATMIKYDRFHAEDSMVSGIAQLAVDKGYDNLSARQKAVLASHLVQKCDGVTDPGGYHNSCSNTLEDDDLESAIENDMYYGGLLCPSCVNEKERYRSEWEKIEQE